MQSVVTNQTAVAASQTPSVPPPPKRRAGVVVTIVVLLIAGALFFWVERGRSQKQAQNAQTARTGAGAERAIPVGVTAVQRRDVPVYLTGLGSVQAFNTVTVRTRVDGQLVSVNFREGQEVRKGDLLAVIDPRPFQDALNQAEATLSRDQANLRNTQLDLERYQALYKAGVIAQQQYNTQQSTVGQVQGAVRADQAAVNNAKLNLVYAHITAPISGRIGLRLVDPGNMVHASDQNGLLVIAQLEPITVLFTLPEDNLQAVVQRIRRGTLEVDAYTRDNRTKVATGKLLTIDNLIDPTTGTFKLKSVFDNHDRSLWPNQFVNARLLLDTMKGALVVPAAAVQHGAQGDFVYVVKPDKTVDARSVHVALTEGTFTVADHGLQEGEQVVTDGQVKLQPGSKVQPQQPTRTAGAGAISAQGAGSTP
jgi:membrane fusion protein, multidrug efflux system